MTRFIRLSLGALAIAVAGVTILRADVPHVFAIKGARIVTVAGTPLASGTIVVRNGLIEAVGADVAVPSTATVIDGAGLTVYPGLIDANSPAIQVPDPDPAAVAALVGRWPGVRWVLAGGRFRVVQTVAARLPGAARVWFDIARVQGPMDCLRRLRDTVGVHRLLFGTNLPFVVPESPVMEPADARLPAAEDAAVRYGNAEAALGIT